MAGEDCLAVRAADGEHDSLAARARIAGSRDAGGQGIGEGRGAGAARADGDDPVRLDRMLERGGCAEGEQSAVIDDRDPVG
jgi:hypothetical protein